MPAWSGVWPAACSPAISRTDERLSLLHGDASSAWAAPIPAATMAATMAKRKERGQVVIMACWYRLTCCTATEFIVRRARAAVLVGRDYGAGCSCFAQMARK